MRDAIKRENINMTEIDKRVLGTCEEKQAVPEQEIKEKEEK